MNRRSLLKTAAAGMATFAGLAVLDAGEKKNPDPVGGFCPSEEEMEKVPWVRGRFENPERYVVPGVEFTSTLVIENSGGADGQYSEQVEMAPQYRYDQNGELITEGMVDYVDVEVPAGETAKADVTMTPPEDVTFTIIEAPLLRSSCDYIQPATQFIEGVYGL